MALSTIFYSPPNFCIGMMHLPIRRMSLNWNTSIEFSTVWDDSKVLGGEIGKYVTIARRKGKEWFVGSITNNDARELKISLSFLEPGKKYEASIYYDDSGSKVRTKVSIRRIEVDASTVLDTRLDCFRRPSCLDKAACEK